MHNLYFSGSPGFVNTISTINVAGPPTYSSSFGTSDYVFTAILSTKLKSPITGTLSFNIVQDNGWNLWFDGVQKINSYNPWAVFNEWFTVSVIKDQYYDLLIRWINGGGPFYLYFYWQGGSISNQIVPSTAFFQEAMVTSSPIQITVSWPTGYTSGQPSYPNTCHELWGDGIRVGSEQCDDGNLINGDGCQADWTIGSGFVWAGGTIVVKDTCVYWTTGLYPNVAQTQWIPHCADSRRAGSEAWDDGNFLDGDGCSSTWTIETGYSWYGGSVTSKDTWVKWSAGYHQDTSNPTQWITIWGDGFRAGSEKCDDANTSSGDGWKNDWSSVESGWVCSGGSTTYKDTWTKWDKGYYQNDASNPTTCVIKWGDGIRVGAEHWDDGNTVSKDGWSSDWSKIEEGFAWFGGYFGVVDVWVEWDVGYDPNPDYSTWIGSEVPRDVNSLATAVQAAAYVGCSVSLIVTVFSSSSSASSRSFGMINQIQLVIILPLIGAYIPQKIYDYLKSMNASLFNLNFLPTSNSGSTISFKSLFTYKQPNSYLYLLQLNSGSAFVNILDLTTTVGFIIQQLTLNLIE